LIGADPPASIRAEAGAEIEITGRVDEVRPYLRRSACLVSPLVSGAGIRNKILEAMAAGVPVVATPMSCDGIRITDGEHVLLGRTAAELAEAATRLLRDRLLRRRLAESAQALVRHEYSWARIAQRYETLYDSVIAERAHPESAT
jgi:glycosyltransferase involved in cell wall biosynthesis